MNETTICNLFKKLETATTLMSYQINLCLIYRKRPFQPELTLDHLQEMELLITEMREEIENG